jgi:hypothetical protein
MSNNHEPPGSEQGGARHGPFHRLESPSQTAADTLEQVRTSEMWGRPAFLSDIPKVKAYRGPLPAGRRGIEFRTGALPDSGSPPQKIFWTALREGVRLERGYAKISIVVVRWQLE